MVALDGHLTEGWESWFESRQRTQEMRQPQVTQEGWK